ncbi:hypothetical protein JKP88DRAFT_285228 [Tribonema minus]|uniref:EF-hand domain-containing protein n=1 Tax=Tribonema minus TaxID=303371 RepID=A0A835ZCW1_9STRA|nr:hypothetical protein JKP88DRAFT_285228 [Tribonema minus]
MGGGISLLPEPDDRIANCIKALCLNNTELAQAFDIFQAHDTAKKGTIPLATFYKMIGERKSMFGDSIFDLLGVRDTREIDFGEWLQAIVTYCLFDESDVLKYCFYILDREKQQLRKGAVGGAKADAFIKERYIVMDESKLLADLLYNVDCKRRPSGNTRNGYIVMDELKLLADMLYDVDPKRGPSGNTRIALNKVPVQADGKIEFWELELFNKAFPSLLYPAFRMQVKMTQLVWGEDWWDRRRRMLNEDVATRKELERLALEADKKRRRKAYDQRVRRKLGVARFYCCPWAVDRYQELHPMDPPPLTPAQLAAMAAAQKTEAQLSAAKAKLKRVMDMQMLIPETEEYRRYKERVAQRNAAVTTAAAATGAAAPASPASSGGSGGGGGAAAAAAAAQAGRAARTVKPRGAAAAAAGETAAERRLRQEKRRQAREGV